jgi:hypothetical protein
MKKTTVIPVLTVFLVAIALYIFFKPDNQQDMTALQTTQTVETSVQTAQETPISPDLPGPPLKHSNKKTIQEPSAELKIGTGVENREVSGSADSFPANVGKVSCWSQIKGVKAGETVTHEWYWGDKIMASVELKINNQQRYRTWSTKTIMKEWTGKWTVKVVDSSGKVLGSADFTVEPAE